MWHTCGCAIRIRLHRGGYGAGVGGLPGAKLTGVFSPFLRAEFSQQNRCFTPRGGMVYTPDLKSGGLNRPYWFDSSGGDQINRGVAQLVSALGSYPKGHRFESGRRNHLSGGSSPQNSQFVFCLVDTNRQLGLIPPAAGNGINLKASIATNLME